MASNPGPITKSGVLFCFELRAFCSDIIQFSTTFLVVVIQNLVKSFSKNAKKCQIGKKYMRFVLQVVLHVNSTRNCLNSQDFQMVFNVWTFIEGFLQFDDILRFDKVYIALRRSRCFHKKLLISDSITFDRKACQRHQAYQIKPLKKFLVRICHRFFDPSTGF